jgi:hypothetical protein
MLWPVYQVVKEHSPKHRSKKGKTRLEAPFFALFAFAVSFFVPVRVGLCFSVVNFLSSS